MNVAAMPVDFKLYLITDRKQAKLPIVDAVRSALKGGVRAVQLREKDLPIRDLLALAREMRALTTEYGAKLFINDRIDVAFAADADGVHLGHQSMPVEAVRRTFGDKFIIGVSAHNTDEAVQAERNGADFITFGPVFRVPSKGQYGNPVGIESIIMAKKYVRLPLFGLGGVKSGNISSVLGSGADGIAMISEILGSDDIERKTREIVMLAGQTN